MTQLFTRFFRIPLAALTLLAPITQASFAAVINADEKTCRLVHAILAANTDAPVGGCSAGSGPDEIRLHAHVGLRRPYSGHDGLPPITSRIWIRGMGSRWRVGPVRSSFRVVHVAPGGDLSLTNLRIEDGGHFEKGANILNEGTLSLDRCRVKGGGERVPILDLDGGGLFNAGKALITRSSFHDNHVSGDGGGDHIFNEGHLTVRGTRFTDGSGIENVGRLVVSGSRFIQGGVSNADPFYGDRGRARIYNSELGFLSNCGTHRVMTSARCLRGEVLFVGGTLKLLENNGGRAVLMNTTMHNSSSRLDFQIRNVGTLELLHVTLVNLASRAGNILASGGTTTIGASLVSGPTSSPNCSISGGSIIDFGSNLADDSTCATIPSTLTGLDPVLRRNGARTRTHALLRRSTAIDLVRHCQLETDQRGFPRSSPCDAGAFERP